MKYQTMSVRTWSFVHFIVDSFTNKAQRRIFRKIETKRQCCVDYIGFDSNVTVFITRSSIALPVVRDRLICIEYLIHVGCQTYTTVSQS